MPERTNPERSAQVQPRREVAEWLGVPLSREYIANLLASEGNYEPKTLLVCAMEPGKYYIAEHLGHELQAIRGLPRRRTNQTLQAASLSNESLIPIGLIVKEDRMIDERMRTVYSLTDSGATIGKAAAGHLNALSERYPKFSLNGFLGATSSASEERDVEGVAGMGYKKRAPELRLRIFEALASDNPPKTLTQLTARLGENQRRVQMHLVQLNLHGILTYESITGNEAIAQYKKGAAFNQREEVGFVEERYVGLNDDVFAYLLAHPNEQVTIDGVHAALAAADERWAGLHKGLFRKTISQIYSYLEQKGYVTADRKHKFTLREDRPAIPPPLVLAPRDIELSNDIFGVIKEMDGPITPEAVQEGLLTADPDKAGLNQTVLAGNISRVLHHFGRSGYMERQSGRFPVFIKKDGMPDEPPPPRIQKQDEALLLETYQAVTATKGLYTKADIVQTLTAANPERGDIGSFRHRVSALINHLESHGYTQGDREAKFTLRDDRPDDTPPPMMTGRDQALGKDVLGVLADIEGNVTVDIVKEKLAAVGRMPTSLDDEAAHYTISRILNHLEGSQVLERANFEKGTYSRISQTPEQKTACTELVDIVHGLESGDESFIAEGIVIADQIATDPERAAALYDKSRALSSRVDSLGPAGIKEQLVTIVEDSEGWTGSTPVHAALKERFGTNISWSYVSRLLSALKGEGRLIREKGGKGYLYKKVDAEQDDQQVGEAQSGQSGQSREGARPGSAAAIAQPTIVERIATDDVQEIPQTAAPISKPEIDIFTPGAIPGETLPQADTQEVSGSDPMSEADVLAHYFTDDTGQEQSSELSEQSIIFQHYGLDEYPVQSVDPPQHERTADHSEIDE